MIRHAERVAERAADAIVRWISGQVHPAHREWVEALAAEASDINNGWARLRWAVNGLPLAWIMRRAPHATGEPAMNAKMMLAELNRRGADLASVGVTLGLVLLVLFFTIGLMPLFTAIAANYGLALPLPARIVLALGNGGWLYLFMLIALAGLYWYRLRRPSAALLLRRFLLTANVVCLLAMAGVTSMIVTTMVAATGPIGEHAREQAAKARVEYARQRAEHKQRYERAQAAAAAAARR